MIRTLKRRFILINMALVTTVLLIVFSTILLFSYQWGKQETHEVLFRILDNDGILAPPSMEVGERPREKRMPMLPAFRVDIDEEGQILAITKDNLEVSEDVIDEVVQRALKDQDGEGVLLDYDLRYLWQESPTGTKLAFADTQREHSSMMNLLITLSLVGLGGLAAFFFISLFLANQVVKPVQKAWDQQRQFVADASHELRTPLTVILANMEILLGHRKQSIEEQEKWIDHSKTEALRMKKLVEDLLFLAKTDDASLPQQVMQLNLSDILWNSILPFESIAYEQGVKIQSEVEPNLYLNGNPGQCKQLFAILLDNAMKYGEKGSEISVSLERAQNQIRLRVHNQGEAIPAEHLGRIFERFYRTDSSRSREEGGYGLGLAIAKTIVEKHRGQIEVESKEGSGTTFTVRFPAKAVDE